MTHGDLFFGQIADLSGLFAQQNRRGACPPPTFIDMVQEPGVATGLNLAVVKRKVVDQALALSPLIKPDDHPKPLVDRARAQVQRAPGAEATPRALSRLQ